MPQPTPNRGSRRRTSASICPSLAGDTKQVLLLHHRRLERWLQPGGHAEPGETRGEQVALREAREETGIVGLWLHPGAARPVDVDVHEIPARKGEPAHLHLDLRYLAVAPEGAVASRSEKEARDLRWFRFGDLGGLGLDRGLERAIGKVRGIVGRA
jgi:8-oxo-dGTP pyrophosphatase MutT (NUDIX family)